MRSFLVVRRAIWVAAAASILVAAFSFVLVSSMGDRVVATVSDVARGEDAGLQVGDPIYPHTPVLARSYAVLTVPEVGTLKLNRDTKIEFLSRREVILHQGELFAEVHDSEFMVRGPGVTARVHGTRFGMSESLVYVVEGEVEVSSSSGRVVLRAEQAARGPKIVEQENASRHAGWIAAYESPDLRVDVEVRGPTWTVTLRTNSPSPVFLRPLRDASLHLYARIQTPEGVKYVVPIEKARVEKALGGPNGLLRLNVANSCTLSVTLEPGMFRGDGGEYLVSVGCHSAADPERPALWSGIAESRAIRVEAP